jgi:hypothetical protein
MRHGPVQTRCSPRETCACRVGDAGGVSTRHPTRAHLVGGRYAVDGRLLRAGVVLDGVDLADDGRRVRVRALAPGEPEPAGALARLHDGGLEVAVLAPPTPAAAVVDPGPAEEPRRATAAHRLGRRRLAALAAVAAVVGALVVHGLPAGGGAAIAPRVVAAPVASSPATPTRRASSSPVARPARPVTPKRPRAPAGEPGRAVRHVGVRRRARPAGGVPKRPHVAPTPAGRADAAAAGDAPPAAPADGEVPPAG